MKKVIRLSKHRQEIPIEITHYQSSSGWNLDTDVDYQDIDEIVYLGRCISEGDVFALYGLKSILICKGHLNDGVY